MHKVLGNEEKQPQMRVGLEQSTALVCKACGHDVFLEASKFRIISKLLIGSQQDAIVPVPVFLCANCGAILEELLPKEMRDTDTTEKKPNLQL